MKLGKKILLFIGVLLGLYLLLIFSMQYLVNNGYTNSESKEIVIENEKRYYLPEETINQPCVQFILKGIENRKLFNDTVIETSKQLGLDYDIVISAIIGEQIRISCKGVRGDLKQIILKSTPTLFRSYNVSVGIAGIKLDTALRIKSDANKYYQQTLPNISEEILSKDDEISGIYATHLVNNIITRWRLEGYDISKEAGIIGTLYNMGNNPKKVPHDNPKIGGAIIKIGDNSFVYGEISLGIYNYLKNLSLTSK